MNYNKNELAAVIEGSKGGGGGSTPPELPNTLASRAILKVLILTSEGPIAGLPGGAKSIYINNTPLQNADNTFNFQNIQFDWRVGTPDQDKVPGFTEAASLVNVGATLDTTAAVVRETSHDKVDRIKIIATAHQGLVEQVNGVLKPTEVRITIQRKLSTSGAWEFAAMIVFNGKTDSATQKQVSVDRPAGLGKWQWRAIRNTADSTISGLRNGTQITAFTEYTSIDNNYPNCAYVALSVDAESVAGQIPEIAILSKGLIVRVPSNYDPVLRTYSGIWNGAFKNAHSDNPAWILYDLITNTRYGLAASGHLTEDMVNRFSFYDAAVYNDGFVPIPVSDENPTGKEPRFTFNYPMSSREDVWKHLTMVAGAMHCTIIQVNGQICLAQDRPEDPSMLVTKANVYVGENGDKPPFTYKGTAKAERQTSFNVTYQDKFNRFLPAITVVEDAAYIDQRGLRTSNIAAFGCTSLTQAIRHGKWALYTSQKQTEIVQFSMGMNGLDLIPGRTISLWDEDYTDTRGGGRVVSATSTTLTLDRPVTIGIGAIVQVVLADGKTIQQRSISNTAGTYTTITVSQAFSQTVLPYADYIVMSAVKARQFRITSVMAGGDKGTVDVEAVFHDPNKYNYVELGIETPAPVYSDSQPSITSAVRDLTARESVVNDNNVFIRSILISWAPPAQGVASSYRVSYRKAGEDWRTETTQSTSFTVNNITPGSYEIIVVALSAIFNQAGPVSTFLLDVNTTGGGASPLSAVTELREAQTGSTTQFLGRDLNLSWLNPAVNSTFAATVRDFRVNVIDANTDAVVYQTYVPGVPSGQRQAFTYTFAENMNNGGPRRRLKVQVNVRDTSNNLSLGTTATFLNPPPVAVNNLVVTGAIGKVYLTLDRPTDVDYVGIVVWRGTSTTFTPAASNQIFQGDLTFFTDDSAAIGTTYWYKVAAYDDFGTSDLNISAAKSGTALNYAQGVPGGTSFPTSPAEGASFYRTDLEKLYFYKAGVWKLTGVNSGTTLPATATNGDIFSNTTDGKLYRYVNGAWTAAIQAVDLGGQIVGTQIKDGEIRTAKLAANAVTANELDANSVTAGKIAADAIAAANIQAGAIGADELDVSSVVAGKIAANAVTVGTIAVGAVVAGTLATNAVTAGTIATDAVTANTIKAGAITTIKLDAQAITADKIAARNINGTHIAAGVITADLINLGVGTNLIPNGTLIERPGTNGHPTGWGTWSNLYDEIAYGTNLTSQYTLAGGTTGFMRQIGGSYAGHAFYDRNAQTFSPSFSVTGGQRYEYSALLCAHRCDGNVVFQIMDYTNTVILSVGPEIFPRPGGNGILVSEYQRVGGFATAPANAAYGRLLMIKSATALGGHTDSYLFYAQPMVAVATSNQTVFSQWTPSGLGTKITAEGITTPSLSALSANVGLLRTAGSGARTEIEANQIRVYDVNNVLRVRMGIW
jgi:predicted phage tail protein